MIPKKIIGVFLGLAFMVLFLAGITPVTLPFPDSFPLSADVGAAMWGERSFEVLLQGVILLGGVVAILLLLGSRRYRERVR